MASLHRLPSAAGERDANMPSASVQLESDIVGRLWTPINDLRMRRHWAIAAGHEPLVRRPFLALVLQGEQGLLGTAGSEQPFAKRRGNGRSGGAAAVTADLGES